MQLAINSPKPVSSSKLHPALAKATKAEETPGRHSGRGTSPQRQTTPGLTKLGSALGGVIPNTPVFVSAERLRKSSLPRSV
jgi:hypothetical protein